MGRSFFSIGGLPPMGGEGGMNSSSGRGTPDKVKLPNPYEHPQLEEWAKSREPTSHRYSGFEGLNRMGDDGFQVEGEEKNHDGSITVYGHKSQKGASGSHQITVTPTDARAMTISSVKRTFD